MSELTGLQRTYLETVRSRVTADDGPAYDMMGDLEPDGLVRFRPATLSEQLDQVVAKWMWEHYVEAEGEVGE